MDSVLDYEKLYREILQNGEGTIIVENKEESYIIAPGNGAMFSNPDFRPVVVSDHSGGVIILFPGDIAITHIGKESVLVGFVEKLIELLNKKDIKVYWDNNDLMVDNKKIFGTMGYELEDGRVYEGLFLTFKPNIDIIRNVSHKEMVKEPIGFYDLGVSHKDIKELIKSEVM